MFPNLRIKDANPIFQVQSEFAVFGVRLEFSPPMALATMRVLDLTARLAVVVGVLLMFAGVFYSLEEGADLRTWDERRLAKRLFFAGATVALAVPVVVFLVELRRRRKCAVGKRFSPGDDFA